VHGAHGFKRCAHASNSCPPSENLKPRFPLHGNFRLYSMSPPQKPTRAFPKSSETAIAGRRRALQIDAPTMRQRCGGPAINPPASRQPR
jgi:cytochrome c peroxidase